MLSPEKNHCRPPHKSASSPFSFEERITNMLASKCKCAEGTCFKQFTVKAVKSFLDVFEAQGKREQDAILFMACSNDTGQPFISGRKEYQFLGLPLKRVCFQSLIGISSHRVDRIGAIDLRYKDTRNRSKPSHLTASIDAFVMILYNSVAEPLPNKSLKHYSNICIFSYVWYDLFWSPPTCFFSISAHATPGGFSSPGLYGLDGPNDRKPPILGQTIGRAVLFGLLSLKRMMGSLQNSCKPTLRFC